MLDLVFTGVSAAVVPPPAEDYPDPLTVSIKDPEVPGLSVAPAAVWFDCEVSGSHAQPPAEGEVYDPQAHDITYVWDFGDAENATPTVALNMPDIWKDTNTAYGKRVAHVFDKPGTYTVTCYAYEPFSRRFGSHTQDILIQDPDAAFPGGRTVVYAPDGTSGLTIPLGANVQLTWAGALAARAANGDQTGRILLAPTADIIFDKDTPAIDVSRWVNARFGALDPTHAIAPKITGTNRQGAGREHAFISDFRDNCVELVTYGIAFTGGWDSTTETGYLMRPTYVGSGSYPHPTQLLMTHRCSYDGFDSLSGPVANSGNTKYYTIASDTSITNWQNFGMLFGGGNVGDDLYIHGAAIGCSIAQHPDALSGGPKNNLYNIHGPIRDFSCASLFISVCDLFSRSGWSAGGTGRDDLGLVAEQPTLRVNTTGIEGEMLFVDRLCSEGTIAMAEQNATNEDVPGNYVFDKVLQIGTSQTCYGDMLRANYGGVSIRNYLGVVMDLPQALTPASNRLARFIEFDNTDGSARNTLAAVRVYNSTGVDLRTDANANEGDGPVAFIHSEGPPFQSSTFENNLLHKPARNGSSAVAGETVPLGTLVAGYAPRHKGPRFNFMHQVGTLSSAVSGNGGTFTMAYAAIGLNRQNTESNAQIAQGAATSQAYWLANGGPRHRIAFGSTVYHAQDGDFTVTFGASSVTITNTSGTDWSGNWALRLDRTPALPGFDPQYDATAQTLGTVNATDPETLVSGDGGLVAYDDYRRIARPATGTRKGALRPPPG